MLSKSLLLAIVALGMLSACNNNKSNVLPDPGYRTARAQSTLELPPDLINSSSITLVQAADSTANVALAPIEGIKLRSSGDQRWLEIAASADNTWARLIDYFNKSGMPILVENKRDGILETDWIGDEESDSYTASLLRNKLGNLFRRAPVNDKFIAWLETMDENNTRINVSHSQLKQFVIEPEGQRSGTIKTGWAETKGDGFKAMKMLRDMAAFLGGAEIETENTAHVVLIQSSPVHIILDESDEKAWTLLERAIVASSYVLDGEDRKKKLFKIRTPKESGFWNRITPSDKFGVVLEPYGSQGKTRIHISTTRGKNAIERAAALPVLWAIAGELRRIEPTN